jgi:hypothetical protein
MEQATDSTLEPAPVKVRRRKSTIGAAKPDIERLAWRLNEFCALVSISREHLSQLQKSGELKVIYLGKTPFVSRIEAVRLGFIAA